MEAVDATRARYVGRFAPSPTGLLHAGSLVAALASWLDARAHGGVWLVRIEDLDTPRNVAGAAEGILAQLDRCGLRPDAPVVRQSERGALYRAALQILEAKDAPIRAHAAARPRSRRRSAGEARATRAPKRSIRALAAPACTARRRDRCGCRSRASTTAAKRASTGSIADLARSTRTSPAPSAISCSSAPTASSPPARRRRRRREQGVTDVVRGEDLADSTARRSPAAAASRRGDAALPAHAACSHRRRRQAVEADRRDAAHPRRSARDAARGRPGARLAARGTTIADWLAAAIGCWRERAMAA